MREIKFRGRRIDNGEWVIGDLTRYSEEMSYITVDLLENKTYSVYTNTVGQYTGIDDIDGKEIYEYAEIKTYLGNYYQVRYSGGGFGFADDYGYWHSLVEEDERIKAID